MPQFLYHSKLEGVQASAQAAEAIADELRQQGAALRWRVQELEVARDVAGATIEQLERELEEAQVFFWGPCASLVV